MSSSNQYLRKLRSDSPKTRLEAARYLAEHANTSHQAEIKAAISKETVLWIQSALHRALNRTSPVSQVATVIHTPLDDDDPPEGFAAQVYAEALETTTAQLIHEIEPLLGMLRVAARAEVPQFEASDTRESIDRLDDFLAALARLRKAASAPILEEFLLDTLIHRCVEQVPFPEVLISTQK